jgi:hypothetical protein
LKIFLSPAVTVSDGETRDVLVDFDLSHSFVPQGNPISGFHFDPVIRATTLDDAGTLAGSVYDTNHVALSGVQVTVTQKGNTIATAGTDAAGNYKILGLVPGWYDVTFTKEGYGTAIFHEVVINADTTTAENPTLVPSP